MILAAKVHKAKCLKILTLARQAIEEESDKLIDSFSKIAMDYATDVAETKTSPPDNLIHRPQQMKAEEVKF